MAITSRTVLVPALLLTAALGLTGCAAGVNDAAGGAPGISSLPESAVTPMSGAAADGSKSAVDRSIIVTGWATILVDDPAAAAQSATGIVEQAGGRVDARSLQAPTDYSGGSATLTLRVPADALDGVLDQLAELGRVQSLSTNASDVTVEVQDLAARIGALRTSIERLEALQAQAGDVDALIALETAISDRQAQLESLEAQQRYYDDQISMSTMTIELVSQAVLAEPEPGSFWDGVQAGWHALLGFLAGSAVALGVLLPWLIPLAVIAAVVWIIVAAAGSRRRKRAAAAAARPPA
ncbi:MAG: hypothetical protein BGO95_06560, partial [Micrococcales bacterium 73-13]